MKRLIAVAGLLVALAFPASSAAFHHGFLPGGPCGESANSGGGNPTARNAIREHNPAQTLPLPPVGTPAADNEHSPITNPPARAECPAPQK